MVPVDLPHNNMISSTSESEHIETAVVVGNIPSGTVPQEEELQGGIVEDESVILIDEAQVVEEEEEEVVVDPEEGVEEFVPELEEGECSDSDSENADLSNVSDTYNQTLDLGYRAPISVTPLLRASR